MLYYKPKFNIIIKYNNILALYATLLVFFLT